MDRDQSRGEAQNESVLRFLLRKLLLQIEKLTLTQGSTTSGQLGPLVQGAVTATAPTYTTGQTSPLSLTTTGALRVSQDAATARWATTHAPAAATQATATKAAAGAGVKNVCTAITVTLASGAVPTVGVVQFVLRDGATGAGTVLWVGKLSLPAVSGDSRVLAVPVNIEGTANTAMTLETTAAPAANVEATVAFSGTTA